MNFWSKNAEKYLADETPSPGPHPRQGQEAPCAYRPYPVVGIISPWNFPLMLSAGDAIPALMAGAAVVIKPSEFTPLELMEVIRGWKEEVGGPDIIDYVNGTGDTGGALIDNVDYMHFTGSDRTGKVVMKRAADTLTPVSLELGGKDPAIVLADAEMDRAVTDAPTARSSTPVRSACRSSASTSRARLRRIRQPARRQRTRVAPGAEAAHTRPNRAR